MSKNYLFSKPISPQIVTLITTYKCTAICENCCFQCSPNAKKMMTYEEMKKYLDECLSFYSETIKLLVLTGGECFLLYDDIVRIVRYADSRGIKTRIITNAYWASSYRKAYEKLKKLKDVGLTEINFSTGDEHQKWVKFEYVKNAAIAATELGYIALINIETKDNSGFDILSYMEGDKFFNNLVEQKRL